MQSYDKPQISPCIHQKTRGKTQMVICRKLVLVMGERNPDQKQKLVS